MTPAFDPAANEPMPTAGQEDVHDALSRDLAAIIDGSNIGNAPEALMSLVGLACATKCWLRASHSMGLEHDTEELVRELNHDLSLRIAMGERKYGSRLKTHNGRNMLVDLYQELLDALHYLKAAQMEGLI